MTALAVTLAVLLVSPPDVDVCVTPGCVMAAARVIKKMDMTAAPCDDFYSFACGAYLRKTHIPDDKKNVGTYQEMRDLVDHQLRSVIEEPESSSDNRPVILAKRVYKSCMNKTRIEALGLKPARKILRQLDGWPVLEGDAWKPDVFDWKRCMYQLRRIGLQTDLFINFQVETDAKNSNSRMISLDVASLGLSREHLVKDFDDLFVDAYYKYMVDIAVLFGCDRERATLELKQSLEFEMSLANTSPPKEERRDANLLYNPMNISELQTKYPSIPWLEYFHNLLPQHVCVSNDDVVNVAVPSYVTKLEDLLMNTDKRVMANYCMWRVVMQLVGYLTQAVQDRTLQYSTALTGQLEQDPRWKTCLDLLSDRTELILGSLFVTKLFDKTSKKAALEMVLNIQRTFQESLVKVDWMDESIKQRALSKAKAMSLHVAYPEELLDDEKLEKFYAKFFVNEKFYVESVLNITRFETDYSWGLLHVAVNKTDWTTHGNAAVVNAFYQPVENSVIIPAAILQGVFFGSDRPKYMNYGTIGFTIGHEITHGFDDQGRRFDEAGNLVDWWDQETREEFLKRAACIVNQYSNYTDKSTGMTLNGVNTQGENIADNGGLKQAYLAYTAWSERSGTSEPRLPGLVSLSPRQMFWVSAAQKWCSKHRAASLKQLIITNTHAPGQFRVTGSMSNSQDFSRDFYCPVGSNMNPEEKCQVW